jgi:hypothetical protein
MSYLSTIGQISVNTELLKELKVNNEYYTLEFYYIEHEKPCLIMHFKELEHAYQSLDFFKKKMLQAQLED